MILRRLALTAAVVTAVAVSGGIVVVALALSAVSLLSPALGWAWAAALVTLIIAVPLAVAATVLALVARAAERKARDSGLGGFVAERPIAALGAALAMGLLATLKPRYLGFAARALMAARVFRG